MSWKLALIAGAGVSIGILLARWAQDDVTGTASWDGLRAAGFAAYLMLWLSVVTGMAQHMRYRIAGASLTWTLEVHRMSSALSLSFVAGHLVGLRVDPTISFSVLDLAVGFTNEYRPWQVALGAGAFWSMVVVLASTASSESMSYRAWRTLHYLAFPAWAMALLHGVLSGTDSGSPLALTVYAGTSAIIAAMLVARLLGRGWVDAGAPAS